jgi:hypothetical protein
MRACIKDSKTFTEAEAFEHALPQYLSDAEWQKGVAWSQFFNFTT